MLPFDTEFQTGEAKITQIRLTVILANSTRLDLTEEHVMLGGFIRDTSTTVDGAFTVGAAVTGKVTVMLDNSDQSLSGYDFRGAVIIASLGGESSPDVFQLLQVGIYTVDEYTYDGSVITLTTYDNFYKFDKPCSETTVTFPITLQDLVIKACEVAGVTLSNSSIPNGSYSITKQPSQWDTMTWHDVVSYCAQIACCFARILPNGKLFFAWYETNNLPGDQYDGGTFDTTTTPYSDGASLDGGDFDYAEAISVDGGTFGDREDVTIIGSIFDITVDTDDVLITGATVSLDPTNNINATDDTKTYEKTLGTAGYIIRIENNPLIETTDNADDVCAFLHDYLVGMRFRPLSASIPENPALEAGDVALVIDRLNNTYTCFLSHVSYTTGAATSISCDAESSMQNLKARYSEAQKTRALAQRTFEKSISDAEAAMQTIMSAIATTMGLYRYTESDGQGGTIYVYGNKNTLASSNIRWKFSAGALMVSSDYGRTWNAAISADGIAVLQEIYAVKVNADNILTGNISIGGTSGNKDGTLLIKDANGNTIVHMNKNGVTVNGGTINGPTLNIGGSGTAGALIIKDASGNTIVSMNKSGASFKGSVQSGSSVSGATVSGGTINGSAISVGGQNNTSGSLEVKNNSNVRICRIDNGGIYFGNIANSLSSPNAKIDNNGTFYSTGTYSIAKYTDGGLILQRAPSGSNCLYVEAYGYTTNGLSCRVYNANGTLSIGGSAGTHINGYLIAGDPKARMINTKNYSNRLLFCYETPTPYFGDIGTGKTDENGEAIIDLDDIFVETIDRHIEYNIFLQKEGCGDIWVEEKECTHFVVKGTPNLKFSWEIKAVQIDAANMRLVDNDIRESGTYIDDDDIGLNMVSDLEMLDQEVLFEEVI